MCLSLAIWTLACILVAINPRHPRRVDAIWTNFPISVSLLFSECTWALVHMQSSVHSKGDTAIIILFAYLARKKSRCPKCYHTCAEGHKPSLEYMIATCIYEIKISLLDQSAEERRMSREYSSFLPGSENRSEINGSPQKRSWEGPFKSNQCSVFFQGANSFLLAFFFPFFFPPKKSH